MNYLLTLNETDLVNIDLIVVINDNYHFFFAINSVIYSNEILTFAFGWL